MASSGQGNGDIVHKDDISCHGVSSLESAVNHVGSGNTENMLPVSQSLKNCEIVDKLSTGDPKQTVNGIVHNHIGREVEKSRGILENLHNCSSPSCLSCGDNVRNKDQKEETCTCKTPQEIIQSEENVLHCQDSSETYESDELPDISELKIQNTSSEPDILDGIEYVVYKSEHQMPDIMRLITKDLSEPYSIYTYRYFIHNWPKLCFLAMDEKRCIGAIVCKLDLHKKVIRRGYIAMLAVDQEYRRRKIGSYLVLKAIRAMIADDCDEVVLETEITNKGALRLYGKLGFVRDKRLFRYYLNGVDALRLKLWLR